MTEQFAVVFYPRTKQSDVVSCDDIVGELGVGVTTKVLSKGRTYPAKILCVGEKEHCERKLQYVTTEGVLTNPSFRTAEGSLGSELTREARSEKDLLNKLSSLLEDVITRLTRLESEMATKALQIEAAQWQQRYWSAVGELRDTSNELLRRVPRRGPAEEAFLFDFAPQSFLEGLRKLHPGNINKFALDLEKKVYEDDTGELALPVEKRVKSANRVEFIKECVYKYYLVPVEARQNVWRAVRAALNSRVRRLRSATTALETTPSRRLMTLFEADAPAASSGASASTSASVFDFDEE
ncbi:unnamed protein product [Cylicocyclus nassatus]|uniref:BEN domain-containing protein n=1 Tax=Cylicocyclus nassatus TaxID=53992 RepID=A0AA36DJZ0_CYLNA|nr:unnamed protein product [Cylicocyclus nassatus]